MFVYHIPISDTKSQVQPEPPVIDTGIMEGSQHLQPKRDMAWKMIRLIKEGQQYIPAWSAFNEFVSEAPCQITTVKYLPFLRAPPTDLSTIYTALLNLVEFASNVWQNHIFVTADLAIYSKAQQILWAKPRSLEGRVTMRLEGMHITMAYIASIGKLQPVLFKKRACTKSHKRSHTSLLQRLRLLSN